MNYGQAQTVSAHAAAVRKQLHMLFTLLFILLLVSASYLLSGCAGVVSGSAKKTTTVGSFQVSPASINFGQVVVGKQASEVLSISNNGSVAISVTAATVSNSQFSVTGLNTPLALAAGQSASFSVVAAPTAAGNLTGTLTLQANEGTSPVVVNLSATAVNGQSQQSQLSLSQSSLNFGNVSVGTKNTDHLVLNNTGTTGLTISLLTLTGSDFTISGITTPKTIAAGQSTTLSITFAPASSGSATGSLTITSSDPVNPTVTVPLSGTGTATATGQLNASPASINFGTVGTGSSNSKQVVLTNSGNAAVDISKITATGLGVRLSGISVPATLNPSQSATLNVSFDPTAAGNLGGSITIVSSAENSPLTISVSGSAAAPGLALSPASYSFGSVIDGQTRSEIFTITNTGTAALTIADIAANGTGYSVSGITTPLTIGAGGTTTFTVLFAPTTAGTFGGTISISSNAPNSPNVLAVSGTGTGSSVSLSVSPSSLTFTNVNAGSSSSKSVTITNNGNTSLTVSQINVNAKDFTVSGMSAPTALAAGQSLSLSVSFSPSTAENVTGNITVLSAQGASSVIAVSGNGVQAGLTVTPASANFGNVTIGSPTTQTFQLLNSGTGTLTITQVSVSGSAFGTGTLSLPINLASGQATNLTVQFAPTSAGSATGSVTIVSNAPNSPAVIALSGTGTSATQLLTFSTTSLSFGNVNTGSSSTQPITITNSGNSGVTVSQISESGAGFSLSGNNTPVTLSAGQTTSFNVVFSPSSAGSDSGTVTVVSTAQGSPTSIALSGTGVAASSHSVILNWVASTSTVSGYNVYRSTSSGSQYAKINSGLVSALTYSDTTVQSGTTYYYVVTAVDASGIESSDSNQATAVIP